MGSSVCLTGFLKTIPVRRQTAIKTASKTIAKIKKLLQAYSMARLDVRFSLKVLNSRNDKDNWTYAPSPKATIEDVSRKIVGVETAGQCIGKTWPSPEADITSSINLSAFLPREDAGRSLIHSFCAQICTNDTDFSKIGSAGQYVSVDGRPLSCERGTAKEIVKLYKSYVRLKAKATGIGSLSDPFINLHIICSPGSYDANVEPAKDDVLFAEAEELTALASDFFKEIYGEPHKTSEGSVRSDLCTNEFDILLRQPDVQEPVSPPATNQLPAVIGWNLTSQDLVGTPETPPADLFSMDNHEFSETEEPGLRSGDNCINPWSIAKTHFIHHSPGSGMTSQFVTPTRPTAKSQPRRITESQRSSPFDISNLSPLASSPSTSRRLPHGSNLQALRGRNSSDFTKASRDRDRERYGNGSLDTWFVRNGGTLSTAGAAVDTEGDTESIMLDDLEGNDHVEQCPQIFQKPSNRSAKIRNTHVEKRQEFPVLEEWSARLHWGERSDDQGVFNSQDTEKALEFEHRKREANRAHRQNLRQAQQTYLATPLSSQRSINSTHKNRYLAAKTALSQSCQHEASSFEETDPARKKSVMNANDSRLYLMRHQMEFQNSQAPNTTRTKRIPRNRLPLETISQDYDTRNLCMSIDVSLPDISKIYKHTAEFDYYMSCHKAIAAYKPFDLTNEPRFRKVCQVWEDTIAKMLKETYRQEVGPDGSSRSNSLCIENIDIFAAMKSL